MDKCWECDVESRQVGEYGSASERAREYWRRVVSVLLLTWVTHAELSFYRAIETS